jgi:hypothetical protein
MLVSATASEGTTLPMNWEPDCGLWVSVDWYPPVWLGRAGLIVVDLDDRGDQ